MFIYHKISLNITYLAFILAILDSIFYLLIKGEKPKFNKEKLFYILVLVSFYALFFISIIYTASDSYAYKKTFLFLPCLISFFYPIFILRINLELLYKFFLFLFLPVTIWFLLGRNLYYTPYSFVGPTFRLIVTNYLNFGVGIGLFILLSQYLRKNWILILLLYLVLLGLGSRGAFLFLLIVVAIWKHKRWIYTLFHEVKLKKKKLPHIFFGLLFVFVTGVVLKDKIFSVISVGVNRFFSLVDYGQDTPSQIRLNQLSFSIKKIFGSAQTFFFGEGIGSFGVLYNGIDEREYPHNIFVEAWFELGIIGFALLGFLMILPLIQNMKRPFNYFYLAFIFLLLNALKTGDLVSIWTIYLFIGLIIFKADAKA